MAAAVDDLKDVSQAPRLGFMILLLLYNVDLFVSVMEGSGPIVVTVARHDNSDAFKGVRRLLMECLANSMSYLTSWSNGAFCHAFETVA